MSSRIDVKKITISITMLLSLTPLFAQKTYRGAEVYSKNTVLYGKFEMSMKMVKGSGMLSTFFTYKNSEGFWEEIDIEIMGKNNATELSSNIITGPSSSTVHHQKSLYPGYTLADTFHTYGLEWTPDYVAWFIDNVELRRDTSKVVDELTSPETYRFNTWISCAPGWAGTIDRSALPQYQYVDWIEYYRYDTGTFTLDWRDDFETFDDTRWSKATWTFDCNEVTFTPDNVTIESGKLVLALTDPNPPSSIDRIKGSESMEVMQNRSTGDLQVKLSESGTYKYHLYDLQGKTISVNEIDGDSFAIPCGECKPGIYFLTVQSKDNFVTRKVLLE
jgi:beta-glucanase (GH16 family)